MNVRVHYSLTSPSESKGKPKAGLCPCHVNIAFVMFSKSHLYVTRLSNYQFTDFLLSSAHLSHVYFFPKCFKFCVSHPFIPIYYNIIL